MISRIIARHLFIEGRVQGVAFRASMVAEAERLSVTGWVRNRRDGRVEAVIQGAPEAVDALVAWAGQGPTRARVTRVAAADVAVESRAGFERRPTL